MFLRHFSSRELRTVYTILPSHDKVRLREGDQPNVAVIFTWVSLALIQHFIHIFIFLHLYIAFLPSGNPQRLPFRHWPIPELLSFSKRWWPPSPSDHHAKGLLYPLGIIPCWPSTRDYTMLNMGPEVLVCHAKCTGWKITSMNFRETIHKWGLQDIEQPSASHQGCGLQVPKRPPSSYFHCPSLLGLVKISLALSNFFCMNT